MNECEPSRGSRSRPAHQRDPSALTARYKTGRWLAPESSGINSLADPQLELHRSNAWDFDDLLAAAVRLLPEQPLRRQWIRWRRRWLLVDEFQDTNHAQAELVLQLAGPAGNLAAVADAQ
jgi:superfamily I DNA/RNA helicase